MVFLCFYTLGAVLLTLLGAFLWKRHSDGAAGPRLAAALLPVSLWNTAVLFYLKIRESYFYDPNWERLQNIFALSAGDPVYHRLNEGPVLCAIYGPVSVWVLGPAVFAQTPFWVMTIAACLTIFYFFAPIFLLHAAGSFSPALNEDQKKQNRMAAAFSMVFFAGVALLSSSLRNAGFRIHVDAQALGLGALACAILVLRRKEKGGGLCLAALIAVLSVWTKQVMVPLLAAMAVYLWIAEGNKILKRYILWVLFWGLSASVLFVFIFGAEPLFISMFYIPGRHALRQGWFLDSILKLSRECLLPLTGAAAFLPVFTKMEWKNPALFIRQNRWALFLITALFLIPTSVLGNGKVGGSNNTLSYTVYFLLAALTFALAESRNFAWKSAVCVLLVLLGIQVPSVFYRFHKLQKEKNYPQIVYDYVRKYPEKGYFPRLNVLSIMAEKKVYHSSFGIIDRSWARLPVSKEHLRAHLPAQMDFLAFREGTNDDKEFFDLPEFWYVASDPELPGFKLYKREN